MGKIRQLKKGLIFLLSFLLDSYQEISIKNYYRAFYLPGYSGKKQRLYELASKLIKTGDIEKRIKKGEIYLKLTSKAGKFFDELISLKKLSEKKWDKIWRLVIFDIKEIDRNTRDKLRRKLKELGFAMWQESVYISPHPLLNEIDEYLKSAQLFPKVICLEAKTIGIKNEKKFAWVIFGLKELDRIYRQLNQKIDDLLKLYRNKKISKKQFFKETGKIFQNYQEVVLRDPFLPKGLINDDWQREKIKEKLFYLMKF